MKKFLLFVMMCVFVSMDASAYSLPMTTYDGSTFAASDEGGDTQVLTVTAGGIAAWYANATDAEKGYMADNASRVKLKITGTLNNDDLQVLGEACFNKFTSIDMSGATLADGASISNIKAGSAIEAVVLPNGLAKKDVNAAGAALATCNANFGSCLSRNTAVTEAQVTNYYYTEGSRNGQKVVESATVTLDKENLKATVKEDVQVDLKLEDDYPKFFYTNTWNNGEVVYVADTDIEEYEEYGQTKYRIMPNPLEVAVKKHLYDSNNNDRTNDAQKDDDGYYVITYKNDAKIIVYQQEGKDGWYNDPECTDRNWNANNVQQDDSGNYYYIGGAHVKEYLTESYTYYNPKTYQDVAYTGTTPTENPDGSLTGTIENTTEYFDVTSEYLYTYVLDDKIGEYTTNSEDTDLKLNTTHDVKYTVEAKNEVEVTSDNNVIAYVNTEGTMYKATALAGISASSNIKNVTISGKINNGDISWGGSSGSSDDPQGSQNDADKYDSNGAVPALVNHQGAPTSIDMSDAVIDNYRHLRVLNGWGASLESVVFPKTVTRIPNYCCYSMGNNGNKNLSEIVFPTEAATLEIGDYAFHHCAVTSLLFPSSTTSVGNYAFATAPNLYDVEMEGLNNNCTFGNNVFDACGALQHVTLSEKVQNVGDRMFNQCGLLESIRIPSTCETIGEQAFNLCYSIHQITIPEGVKLIKMNAFENAGLTDIYLMATTPAALPKIYAMSPTGAGPSTFSYQRTTGNNTVPDDAAYLAKIKDADYDEVMTWYQEDQSGAQGLGTGNCLTALHYPESMKDFFEGINYPDFPDLDLTGVVNYKKLDEYLAIVGANDKVNTECLLRNKLKINNTVSENQARDFGTDEHGNPIEYKYLPQSYSIDPDGPTNNDILLVGPDKDGRYYPIQECYLARMAAGATGVNSGGADGVASQWGWRQFPLSSSIESIGETPFEKEYDDTWYTMCFPWRMVDNQLFSAFNQKCEIVEFVGAEVLDVDNPATENVKEYSLVFHFDEVAKTYYMDDKNVEYTRKRDGDRVDAAGHDLYIYTQKDNPSVVISCPAEAASSSYNPKNASVEVKEAYGKYLNIQNIMVVAGHPYMIHPSIGASPGHPATVYINGVKKIKPGEGLYTGQTTFDAVAEANKVVRTVSSRTRTRTVDGYGVVTDTYNGATTWTNPETGEGGKYYFIGNINDEVKDEATGKISREGYKDLPAGCYYLGVPDGDIYPKYFKRKSIGSKMWSNYSAIILPDADALANVERLNGMTVSKPTGGEAKGAFMELGAWDFDEISVIDENGIATVIEDAVEKDKSAEIVRMNVVYNIKGQVVRADSGSVQGLPKGIYIVNGKKYMVK